VRRVRDHRGIDLNDLLPGELPDPAADEPLLTGTSVEVARRLGVSPLAARAAFAVTTFASGLGIVVYLLCWAVLVRAPAVRAREQHAAPLAPGTASTTTNDPWRTVGLGLLVVAVMVTAIGSGWARASLVWPAMLVGAGVVIAWAAPSTALGRDALRQAGGAVLVLSGLLVLVADRLSWSLLVDGAVTGVVVLVGIVLVLGPWVLRTGRATAEERRVRVRAEEREAVAAHLHDSVLQTLTLIQKRATDPSADPRLVAALARRQERELRRWLYGRTDGWAPQSRLRDALDVTVADVEDLHGVTVEAVVVGDVAVDERIVALVAAAREALVNAAKFSGERDISLFAEAAPHEITIFVRDRGVGFDPEHVPPDRRGIRDSIVGRMARIGGHATVRSAPGSGVEVELVLPVVDHEGAQEAGR
jgi:signal transduction histidine kinase